MPSILGQLFGSPADSPTAPLLDINAILKQGSDYNQGQYSAFQKNAPDQATFMQNLYGQLSPQVQQAQNTNFSLGQQLATQGYSNAQKGALDYYRQLGLQTAASTGAPLSSQFAQNLGAGLGAQNILANQEWGSGLLNQTSQFQNQLSNQDISPSLSVLQRNMIDPTSLFAPSEYNQQVQTSNNQVDFLNSQNQSWIDSLLTKTLASTVSTPFNFTQSANSVVSNAPQLFASMFAGGAAMNGQNEGTLGYSGGSAPGAGGGSSGGGGGGIFSSLMGGGGAGAGCCFIFMESLNGKLPWYVRKARDTRAINATVKGYRRMSRWLVPAMRLWKAARHTVNFIMVKPMLMVSEDYYTPKKSFKAKCLKPVVAFWFTVWTILGLTVGRNERGRDAT